MEEPFTDMLVRIRKGSRTSFPVEAWLSDGSFYEGTARLTSTVLQRLLESDLEPVRYGQRLFETLFDGSIATAYDVATGLARQRSGGLLRLRLLLDDSVPPELHALKWERLADLQGIPLSISGHTPLSRYMALPEAEPVPLDEPRVRLLFVISAPRDLEQWGLASIDVEKEVRRLRTALLEVTRGERCQATLLHGQTALSEELRADLSDAGWTIVGATAGLDNIGEWLRGQHVLHFLGHGRYRGGQGSLLLEQADGTSRWEADTDLAARLANTPVRLVVLTACESARRDGPTAGGAARASTFEGLAASLVRRGVPAVVAMQEQVSIEAAYRLTGEFYRRLFLEHGIVDRALNEARAMLFYKKERDWATPVLNMRLKTGQLATANVVWTALQAIAQHTDYTAFRTDLYIPMPLQAMLVNEGQDASQYEPHELQQIGTLGLVEGILSHLASAGGGSAAPLVLVLGGPSTGKSTQIKRVGWETVQAGLEERGKQARLPLYLDLQDYRPVGAAAAENLERSLLDQLRLFVPDLTARSLDGLERLMPQARLRVLLNAGDTLPEVGRDLVKLMVALARAHPRHEYVLAAQPSALNWSDLADMEPAQRCVLAIRPLTQRDVRHTLDAQGTPGRRLLDALHDSSLFDLASTPFFLVNMLLRARKGQIPNSRAMVLQQLIDEAITRLPAGQGLRANAPETCYEMARQMQVGELTVWPIEEAFRLMASIRGARGYAVEELYAALVEQQLLLPVGEDAVRFAYSSIQAYCCARAILARPDSDRALRDLGALFGSPVRMRWWEETLVVTSGLLAADRRPQAQQALLRLLEPIIRGADLLKGSGVFATARCLLECRSVLDGDSDLATRATLQQLADHVVSALIWRSNSDVEPDLAQRLQATQFLAQLAGPLVAVDLARQAYCAVRKNATDEWDYEFSSVRYAAAIALKRMPEHQARDTLHEISPKLIELFVAWQGQQVEALIEMSRDRDDLGIQGLAALALGDVHGRLDWSDRTEAARSALARLNAMFTGDETPQSVRWSVADALSLLDSGRVTQEVVNPLLDEFAAPEGRDSTSAVPMRKALAYLIGLLRLSDERAHSFLVDRCLELAAGEGPRDWKTWVTAITALGRVAAESDVALLAEISAGRARGVELAAFFPVEAERNRVRREALQALANQCDLELWDRGDRKRLARDPALFETYYDTIEESYWRREAAARTARGGQA